MKSIKLNRHYIFLLYINLLLGLLIMQKSFQVNHFKFSYITMIFILTMIIWWFYKDILKKWLHKILFTIGLLLVMGVFFYFNKELLIRLIDYYIQTINEFNTAVIEGQKVDFLKFKPYINLVLPILIIGIINIMVNKWSDFILVLMIGFIISFWYIGYSAVIKQFFFCSVFVILFTYLVLRYINYYNDSIKKGFNVSISIRKSYCTFVFSSLIVAILCIMFPKNITWKYSSDIKKKVSDSFKKGEGNGNIKVSNSYDLSFAGYNNSSKKLGGPIVLNDLIAFKVKSELPHYLRGVTKDYYDGYSWTNSKNEYVLKNENILYNKQLKNIISKEDKIIIYPDKLKTAALMTPMYSYSVMLSGDDEGNKLYYNPSDKTLISEYMINNSYAVNFYGEDVYSTYLNSNMINDGFNNNINEKYSNYRDVKEENDKYDKYLQIPNNVSSDIFKLVNDITKDCNGELDKIYKIRTYLRENYKYSIDVSEIPEGKEFIEYFINEERKGYCTYFATATTIFCRIAGIPARYVEGFNMTNKKDENGLYLVSNKNAHAWTEVLVLPNIDAWGILDCVPDAEEMIKKEEEDKINNYNNNENEFENKELKNNKVKNEDLELLEDNDSTKNYSYIKHIKHIYIVLSVIVFCFISKFIYIMIRKHYICNSNSVKPLFSYIVKRLRIIKINIPNNVTEMEFVNTLNDIELKKVLKEVVESLYAEVYGNKNNNIDKRKLYNWLEEYMKKNQGLIKYYIKITLY